MALVIVWNQHEHVHLGHNMLTLVCLLKFNFFNSRIYLVTKKYVMRKLHDKNYVKNSCNIELQSSESMKVCQNSHYIV